MRQQILLAALGSSILLAVALFWVLRAERRKAMFEPRLRAIAVPKSNSDQIIVSLRRPRPHRKALPRAEAFRIMRDEVSRGWWDGHLAGGA